MFLNTDNIRQRGKGPKKSSFSSKSLLNGSLSILHYLYLFPIFLTWTTDQMASDIFPHYFFIVNILFNFLMN